MGKRTSVTGKGLPSRDRGKGKRQKKGKGKPPSRLIKGKGKAKGKGTHVGKGKGKTAVMWERERDLRDAGHARKRPLSTRIIVSRSAC